MTAQEMEIRRRRRLGRLKRERQVRQEKRMLVAVLMTISAIIAGVLSIPQHLAEAPRVSTVEVEAKEALDVQVVSGTQVLEGVAVEESTESNETTEATAVVEAAGTVTVTTSTSWMNYSSADVSLLANIMYAEEGVLYTMYYDTNPVDVETVAKLCGSVVLHRLANNMGGATTIREVLYAQGQYAGTTKTRIENGQDVPELFYTWAEELLQYGPLGPNNLVFQAEFAQGDVYAVYWNQVFGTASNYPAE